MVLNDEKTYSINKGTKFEKSEEIRKNSNKFGKTEQIVKIKNIRKIGKRFKKW